MTWRNIIKEAVAKATSTWPQIPSKEPVDPNPTDILYLAENIQSVSNLAGALNLRDSALSKEQVASIVELVEKLVLAQSPNIVRYRSAEQLTNELNRIGTEALRSNPELGSVEEAIAKSLFLWFGCIMMAKVCRDVDSLGNKIPLEHRYTVHSMLVKLSETNVWIKAGFTSTKAFLKRRDQIPIDEWIPASSPYFEN